MEKTGLVERLRARRQARQKRSTERARLRQENKIEGDPRRVKSKSTGASGGV